jgi:hypothetical protein
VLTNIDFIMNIFVKTSIKLIVPAAILTLSGWLIKVPSEEYISFKYIDGPKYFFDTWLDSHREGYFKMPCYILSESECHIETKNAGYSHIEYTFLHQIDDTVGIGHAILLVDNKNILEHLECSFSNIDTVYFTLSGSLRDSRNSCDPSLYRIDENIAIFRMLDPDVRVVHNSRAGYGILVGFIGLLVLAALWRI